MTYKIKTNKDMSSVRLIIIADNINLTARQVCSKLGLTSPFKWRECFIKVSGGHSCVEARITLEEFGKYEKIDYIWNNLYKGLEIRAELRVIFAQLAQCSSPSITVNPNENNSSLEMKIDQLQQQMQQMQQQIESLTSQFNKLKSHSKPVEDQPVTSNNNIKMFKHS